MDEAKNHAAPIPMTGAEIDFILSPAAIRAQAEAIFARTRAGETGFSYQPDAWPKVVETVLETIRENYPSLEIPFHSRWGHFRAGGQNRVAKLDERLKGIDAKEVGRVMLDLVIPSVLLDAGAGMGWRYREEKAEFARSEGLGIASFHWFLNGAFSSDERSLRTDAEGLSRVKAADLEMAFQVSEANPLVGVAGRVKLLNNLGGALQNRAFFKDGRPGNLIDTLESRYGKTIPATGILRLVLDALGPIWPGRLSAKVDGSDTETNLGDVWRYRGDLVPFHKLSQWMTYSLIEPIEAAGFTVTGVEQMTGLAEYRNGGLFVDAGVITPRDPQALGIEWGPESAFVIEWRALTVALLDRIGEDVRQALGKRASEFPLAKVLEGGTWWAGRKLAARARADGAPPIRIRSDGTVF